MNQLKNWGFSAQWWRGEKGEYWVLGQTILAVGFVLLPVYPAIAYSCWKLSLSHAIGAIVFLLKKRIYKDVRDRLST